MANYQVSDIRNIALVGHRASGKTSLADALLFKAKAVDRRGSVDDGTSVSDYDEEEHKRHFSIDTSVLHLEHKGKQIHLLDTPGDPDFVGAALGALSAVENVLVVVSAANGIEVNTRRMFNEAGKRGLARMLVLNKLDADNIKFNELLKAIRDTFGKGCVLFNAPDQRRPALQRRRQRAESAGRRAGRLRRGPDRGALAAGRCHRRERRRAHGEIPARRLHQRRRVGRRPAEGDRGRHGHPHFLHGGQERHRHRRVARRSGRRHAFT